MALLHGDRFCYWGPLIVSLVLLFFLLPHGISGDAFTRFEALRDLIEQGKISNMTYSFAGPLASAPFYFLGKLYLKPEWWCARFNLFVFATGLLIARRPLYDEAERRLLRKFALLLITASMFPNHLQGYGGEVFTSCLVAVGILAVRAGRVLAGWTAVIIGVVNTPATLAGLALAAAAEAWETRRWRHIAAVPVAAALILLEAWIRHGNPWVTGYENNAGFRTIMPYSGLPEFSYPFSLGVLSIVFSFGKGLVFFAPGLLLWLRRHAVIPARLYTSYRLWMWFLAGLILVYAKWWAWYGGFTWGPRFFLFASVPASLAIAVRLQHLRRSSLPALSALLLVLTLSVWVGINGAVFASQDLMCWQNDYALEFLCWYVPEFSALWRPFITRVMPPPQAGWIIAYCSLVYVWLAAPVMIEIARQARARFRIASQT